MVAFTDEWGHTENLKNDSEQFKRWYNESVDTLKETLELIKEVDELEKNGWKVVADDKSSGDVVYVKSIDKRGKTFALTAVMEGDPKHIFEINFYQSNDKPHWNPTIKEYKVAVPIGDQTRLIYWCSNDILAGLVSSRDFVDVQSYRQLGDSYVIIGKGTECTDIPPQKGRVRGESAANIMKMSPIEGKPGFTKLTWIMSTDLKGMLPKAVVDRAQHYMMLEYVKQLRVRAQKAAIIA